MSEQGDLNQAIVEEGRTEQEAAPENGIVKSESLDEEEKLELQVSPGRPSSSFHRHLFYSFNSRIL
jgi:hypothetical protein